MMKFLGNLQHSQGRRGTNGAAGGSGGVGTTVIGGGEAELLFSSTSRTEYRLYSASEGVLFTRW